MPGWGKVYDAIAKPEKRNAFLLVATQALFQTAAIMVTTISGLVGLQLADDKSLSTLPMAMMLVVTALIMIPARDDSGVDCRARRCRCHLAAAWLFALAPMFMGGYQGFARYYRFAAADVASTDFKSRAISWVVAGGVIVALAGPTIVRLTQRVGSVPFMAPYLVMVGLGPVAMLIVIRLELPPMQVVSAGSTRVLSQQFCANPFS